MAEVLHRQLAERLRGRITSGDWPVGERLPPEVELAAALEVSRSTLRQALGELEAAGLVQRRKRAGTTVIAREPAQSFRMTTTGFNEVLSLSRETALEITGQRHVADGTVALLEGLLSGTGHWLEVTGQRRIEGQATPFNWSRIYVPGRYAGIGPGLERPVGSVYGVIEAMFGVRVGRVNQSVTATPCPGAIARGMGLEPGAPVTRIIARLYDREDGLIEVSHALFDPARFQVNTDVRIS
ncbi:GntR family transcriptional regulator (plasmid) [Paroceanicella profunda]|uniref:GntR family transcriptional regulator n=1 Tax=Paroceanicella profunda TaxID=2579971 RepID=A0A5B8G1D4_9RHOB|nr:GntR family transcriptional regulator [Paroceanicella profunda]QDL94926.1 GntR family transcriptional regulator [Paroceanicella profunda]